MRRRVLGSVLGFVLVATAASACSGSDPGLFCGADEHACVWPDNRIASCAQINAGFYGTFTEACGDGCSADQPSSTCAEWPEDALWIEDAAGAHVPVFSTTGIWEAEARPGAYQLCAPPYAGGCHPLVVTDGAKVRVDVTLLRGRGTVSYRIAPR